MTPFLATGFQEGGEGQHESSPASRWGLAAPTAQVHFGLAWVTPLTGVSGFERTRGGAAG